MWGSDKGCQSCMFAIIYQISKQREDSLYPWNMRGNIKRIKILISLYHPIYRTFMKPNLHCCGILGHNFHNKRGVKRNIDWGSFNLPIMVFHHCFYSLKSCLIDDYIYFVCDERRTIARLALFFPNRNLDFSISTQF